ncbi:hypothetical protein ACOME3_003603 [Neoechinorhynchus agilis]
MPFNNVQRRGRSGGFQRGRGGDRGVRQGGRGFNRGFRGGRGGGDGFNRGGRRFERSRGRGGFSNNNNRNDRDFKKRERMVKFDVDEDNDSFDEGSDSVHEDFGTERKKVKQMKEKKVAVKAETDSEDDDESLDSDDDSLVQNSSSEEEAEIEEKKKALVKGLKKKQVLEVESVDISSDDNENMKPTKKTLKDQDEESDGDSDEDSDDESMDISSDDEPVQPPKGAKVKNVKLDLKEKEEASEDESMDLSSDDEEPVKTTTVKKKQKPLNKELTKQGKPSKSAKSLKKKVAKQTPDTSDEESDDESIELSSEEDEEPVKPEKKQKSMKPQKKKMAMKEDEVQEVELPKKVSNKKSKASKKEKCSSETKEKSGPAIGTPPAAKKSKESTVRVSLDKKEVPAHLLYGPGEHVNWLFIQTIPKDTSEEDVRSVFVSSPKSIHLRRRDDRLFSLIEFADEAEAQRNFDHLIHGATIKGQKCVVRKASPSIDRTKLNYNDDSIFVKGINENITKEILMDSFPECVSVSIHHNKIKRIRRFFAFVRFAEVSQVKKYVDMGSIELKDNAKTKVTILQAIAKNNKNADKDVHEFNKTALHVSGFKKAFTEDDLKALYKNAKSFSILNQGKKKPRVAFVFFETEDQAAQALKETSGLTIDNSRLVVGYKFAATKRTAEASQSDASPLKQQKLEKAEAKEGTKKHKVTSKKHEVKKTQEPKEKGTVLKKKEVNAKAIKVSLKEEKEKEKNEPEEGDEDMTDGSDDEMMDISSASDDDSEEDDPSEEDSE